MKFGFRCSCYSLKPKYLSGFFFFFFFSRLGHDLGHGLGPNLVGLNGACGARRGGSGPRGKNPFDKEARFGPQVLTRGSGSGMKKPDPNPTHCHSYKSLMESFSLVVYNPFCVLTFYCHSIYVYKLHVMYFLLSCFLDA